MVIAQMSYPSTGLGIELGFLYDDNKRIYCIHKDSMKISSSINAITKNIYIYEYKNKEDMLNIINDIIKLY